MKPNQWLHRQPIPKLRSTLKHLTGWSSQDIVALAYKQFSKVDLTNKDLAELVKLLKLETTRRVDPAYYFDGIDTSVTVTISLKPNRLKLHSQDGDYKSGKWFKKRHSSLDEALRFSLGIIQDSKVCWEEAYKNYLETTVSRSCKNMLIPLPDNTCDTKKYWGLQVGDKLLGPEGQEYTVTNVRPVLDGPPVITYEEL